MFRSTLAASALVALASACYIEPAPGGTTADYSTVQQGTGAGPAQLQIANSSNESIHYIYMSPCSQSTWGPDLLGDATLARGQVFTIGNIQPGCWDLRTVDASHNYKEWRGQTFGAGAIYNLAVSSQGWVHD